MTRNFQVIRQGQLINFTSDLTDAQAIEALRPLTSSTFAQDLYRKSATLSAKQMAWAHKLAIDAAAPRPVIAGVAADLSGVVALFARPSKLKFPKITLSLPSGVTIKLSRSGNGSKYPGTIAVTDENRYPDNKYFGRIMADGTLQAGRNLTDEIRAALVELAADPVGYAVAYGKKTGACCFCGKALDTRESVAVGYGPTCAKSWSLPWGAKAADAVEAAQAEAEMGFSADAMAELEHEMSAMA